MVPLPISVTIITLNEERNLPRLLESLQGWVSEILVLDSGSTDRTVQLARDLGARVVSLPWEGYGHQKNRAQELAFHDWILNVDADEVVSPELKRSLLSQFESGRLPTHRAFWLARRTWYLDRWIRHGGWYPNHLLRFYDRRYARWSEPKIHEQLQVVGTLGTLEGDILHFSFPSISSQVETNLRFSRLGYQELLEKGYKPSLLRLIFKPLGKFLETYVVKRGFLDGLPGFLISINAAHSMFLKYAYFFEKTSLNSETKAPSS